MEPSPTLHVLQASGLTGRIGSTTLFERLDFDLPTGITVVRGGEGCGKTTLLRMLAGEREAGSGNLSIGSVDQIGDAEGYRAKVFWVDPRTQDFEQVTVRALLAQLTRRWPPQDEMLLTRLIDGMGLSEHLDKPLYMLSTGSRRKVWLAAGMSAGATVTLFDQPFAGVDAASCRYVCEQLTELASQQGRAWVIADYEAPARLLPVQVIDLGDG